MLIIVMASTHENQLKWLFMKKLCLNRWPSKCNNTRSSCQCTMYRRTSCTVVPKPVDTENNNNNVISHQLGLKSKTLFSSLDVSKTTPAHFISKETQTSENICDGLSPDYALKYAALSYLERSQWRRLDCVSCSHRNCQWGVRMQLAYLWEI